MRFHLHYRGSLKPNGGPTEKQELRRAFHPQLKDLWGQKPLNELTGIFFGEIPEFNVIRKVGAFDFAPLATEAHNLVVRLSITLLRPEEPGGLITVGGDIDNRLKTLLDALSVPNTEQVPNDDVPDANEMPFYCLLEDDNLVTGFSVDVDRLLDSADEKEVFALIQVDVTATRTSLENLAVIL